MKLRYCENELNLTEKNVMVKGWVTELEGDVIMTIK